jgi:hypothetical protein
MVQNPSVLRGEGFRLPEKSRAQRFGVRAKLGEFCIPLIAFALVARRRTTPRLAEG